VAQAQACATISMSRSPEKAKEASMKKPAVILLALICVLIVTGTTKLNGAPPSQKPGIKKPVVLSCAKVGGKYDVTKIINSLNCTKGGAAVPIPDWQNAMAETSTLSIGQGYTTNKCKVSGADTIGGSGLKIPVAGVSNKTSQFSLSNENQEELALPLKLTVNNKYLTCTYKGGITYNATIAGSGHLKGKINSSLSLAIGDERCPDKCALVQEFEATNPN
jgi:hypothetical protein